MSLRDVMYGTLSKLTLLADGETTSSNPADYLKGNGSGTFSGLTGTLKNMLADAYGMVTTIGIGLLGVALVIAFVSFGILKDNSGVRENKQWIVRLIIGMICASAVLTIVGIATGIGQSVK